MQVAITEATMIGACQCSKARLHLWTKYKCVMNVPKSRAIILVGAFSSDFRCPCQNISQGYLVYICVTLCTVIPTPTLSVTVRPLKRHYERAICTGIVLGQY
jgi:hypothetical protein